MREIATTVLELVGIVCMVTAVGLLAGGAWALLAAGAALFGVGVLGS